MRGKKTKGKQKINIGIVENDEDISVKFSKRISEIYTKLSDLSILCDADVGFLAYSDTGKPYTFGSPSFDAVAERFLNGNHGEGSSSSSTVDAQKKVKMEELYKSYSSLVEQSDAEEKRAAEEAAAAVVALPVEKDAWWKIDPTEVKDDEEAKQLLGSTKSFMKNFVKLLQKEDVEEK